MQIWHTLLSCVCIEDTDIMLLLTPKFALVYHFWTQMQLNWNYNTVYRMATIRSWYCFLVIQLTILNDDAMREMNLADV